MQLKSRLEYAAFLVAHAVLGLLPRRSALAVGAAAGQLLCWVALPLRRVAMTNLAIAFPDITDHERRRILAVSCRNLGRVAAEFCQLRRLRPETIERYVAIPDREAWQRVIEQAGQRGAIIVTGHFGNWELLAYAQGLLGHPITLVHKPMRNPWVDRAVVHARARAGTRSIPKRAAAREALRTLRDHGMLVIPMDQNQRGHEGVFIDLYGIPACTNPGAARLARHTGAALVPVFLVRKGQSARHRVDILPMIEPSDSGAPDRDLVATTQACSDVVADMVRRHPEQWIWFHKRWRTRPEGDAEIY